MPGLARHDKCKTARVFSALYFLEDFFFLSFIWTRREPARRRSHGQKAIVPSVNPKNQITNATHRTAAPTISLAEAFPISTVIAATAKSDVGETKDDRLTLYYDPFVSQPAIIPEELARVTWNGEAYTIRSVTPCYTQGGDAVHHYEAALV